MEEYVREPCPWRIMDDCGGAFAMGLIGGGLFQSLKGYKNAPAGIGRRAVGSLEALKQKTPAIAGSFAVWGGVFSLIDCGLVQVRKKEDPWNSIISATITGALLSARTGVSGMVSAGIIAGGLLAVIEGVSIFFTRYSADQFKPVNPALEDPSQLGPASFTRNSFQ